MCVASKCNVTAGDFQWQTYAVPQHQWQFLWVGSNHGQCGDGVLDPGEQCDCGDIETCVQTSPMCVPPGLRRSETECSIRFSGDSKNTDCSRLGLKPCQCKRHENAVSAPACESCCRGDNGDCRSAEEWTVTMFDEIQHYLARLCWSWTVSTCMASIRSHKYAELLNRLSSQRLVQW